MMAVGACLLARRSLPLAKTLTGEADAPMPAAIAELPAAEPAPQTEEAATVQQAVAAVRDIPSEDTPSPEAPAIADASEAGASDTGASAGPRVEEHTEDTHTPPPKDPHSNNITPAPHG